MAEPVREPRVGTRGVAVGWRAQDDAQVDPDLGALGPSVALGLAPEATNRLEVSAAEGLLAAVWEEATADGDVVVQRFDAADGAAPTGPVRVHHALEADAGAVLVAWESGDPPAVAVRAFALEPGGP